jgi:hypothetical protein
MHLANRHLPNRRLTNRRLANRHLANTLVEALNWKRLFTVGVVDQNAFRPNALRPKDLERY